MLHFVAAPELHYDYYLFSIISCADFYTDENLLEKLSFLWVHGSLKSLVLGTCNHGNVNF
jgi:hypothetical protein